MSELDLGQKVAARRLLWQMGYSTRIDVVLRAVELARGRQKKGQQPESFTDIDVLGVAVTPSGHVQTSIVDCKTGGSPIIGRMFWVRGLAELFKADAAYMVRDTAISTDARQLAERLRVTALTESEVTDLSRLLQTELPLAAAPLSQLFDVTAVSKSKDRFVGHDRRLKPLMEYRQFTYWVYPQHGHLIGLVDALLDAREVLHSSNPIHVALVLDCAWLYLLALARCVGELRSAHPADLRYGLSQYLAGGALQLNQKQEIAQLLAELKDARQMPNSIAVNVDPRFFGPLLELVTRILRRGHSINDGLRLLEFQSESILTTKRQLASDAFGPAYNPTAAKLASDVVDFLVKSAELAPAFSRVARDVLMSTTQTSVGAAEIAVGAPTTPEAPPVQPGLLDGL